MERSLMQLIIERTSPLMFCLAKRYTTSFIHQLLSWASYKSLIMNSVLAVRTYSKKPSKRTHLLEAKRLRCYGEKVGELKLYLTRWNRKDLEEALRLLTITCLLVLNGVTYPTGERRTFAKTTLNISQHNDMKGFLTRHKYSLRFRLYSKMKLSPCDALQISTKWLKER